MYLDLNQKTSIQKNVVYKIFPFTQWRTEKVVTHRGGGVFKIKQVYQNQNLLNNKVINQVFFSRILSRRDFFCQFIQWDAKI